jgi:hypothetical protein
MLGKLHNDVSDAVLLNFPTVARPAVYAARQLHRQLTAEERGFIGIGFWFWRRRHANRKSVDPT